MICWNSSLSAPFYQGQKSGSAVFNSYTRLAQGHLCRAHEFKILSCHNVVSIWPFGLLYSKAFNIKHYSYIVRLSAVCSCDDEFFAVILTCLIHISADPLSTAHTPETRGSSCVMCMRADREGRASLHFLMKRPPSLCLWPTITPLAHLMQKGPRSRPKGQITGQVIEFIWRSVYVCGLE